MTPRSRRTPEPPPRQVTHAPPPLLTATALATAALVLTVLVCTHNTPLLDLDRRTVLAATTITRTHHELRTALLWWQALFTPTIVYLATLPLLARTWRTDRHHTIWAATTMLTGWALAAQAKLLVQRPRPLLDHPVTHAPGYSFPSGHAFNTTLMLTTCLIVLHPHSGTTAHTARRLALTATSATLILLTDLDRIFLGVHYLSDVIAGTLLALAMATVSRVVLLKVLGRSRFGAERSGGRETDAEPVQSEPTPPRR